MMNEVMDPICHVTGLSKPEIELVIRIFDNLALPLPWVLERSLAGVLYGKETLINNIAGEAHAAHQDMNELGIYTATFDSNAEQPYHLSDLLENIRKLSDHQAECLIFFIQGWQSGARCER